MRRHLVVHVALDGGSAENEAVKPAEGAERIHGV
jgi:hypothetical protein